MAIDFGAGDVGRYYQTPDDASMTFPGTDWTWAALVYPQNSAIAKYILSNGAYQTVDHFNLFCYQNGSFGFAASYGHAGEIAWGNGNVTMDKWYWLYCSRRGDFAYVGAAEFGGGIAAEGGGINISSITPIDSPNPLKVGGRFTSPASRFWAGRCDRIFYAHGYGMTLADAQALSGGVLPANATFAANIDERWNLTDSSAASIAGVGDGNILTKNGTGYGANTASPYGGATVVKGVQVILHDATPTALANQVNVDAIFFDVADPEDFILTTVPKKIVLKGTLTATGLLQVDVDSETSLNVGQNGYLIGSIKDGSDHRDSDRFQSRVTIVDIA